MQKSGTPILFTLGPVSIATRVLAKGLKSAIPRLKTPDGENMATCFSFDFTNYHMLLKIRTVGEFFWINICSIA